MQRLQVFKFCFPTTIEIFQTDKSVRIMIRSSTTSAVVLALLAVFATAMLLSVPAAARVGPDSQVAMGSPLRRAHVGNFGANLVDPSMDDSISHVFPTVATIPQRRSLVESLWSGLKSHVDYIVRRLAESADVEGEEDVEEYRYAKPVPVVNNLPLPAFVAEIAGSSARQPAGNSAEGAVKAMNEHP